MRRTCGTARASSRSTEPVGGAQSETTVRSLGIAVLCVAVKRVLEMPSACEQRLIEKFMSYGAHGALSEGIGLR